MALPAASPSRQLKHSRRFDIRIYSRDDGLWEVDATLDDVKTRDVELGGSTRRAGDPVHEMQLRLVVDRTLTIVAAGSDTRWMPYAGICDDHGEAYGKLVGLNLARGFRRALLDRLAGVRGCTHLSELAQVLPTAVIQAFAGEVIDTRGHDGDSQPFQIDRCHALRADGEAVRLHYPRWHRPQTSNGPTQD